MYWRQWVAAIFGGLVAGYYFTQLGYSISQGLYVAGIGLVLIRWTLAIIGRSRYWTNRGTRGVHTDRCPNCHKDRHRVSGDWILTCKNCGWQPGFPGVRWITHSVPAIQLRRSISPSGLIIVLVLVFVLLSGWMAPFAGLNDGNKFNITQQAGNRSDQASVDTTTTGATQNEQKGLNTTKMERLVWRYTNEIRQKHGLSSVRYDSQIAALARNHSENMAEHDYIGHTEPNGETGEERYNHVCDFPGSGYTLGENVNGAWYNKRMIAWHSNETIYLSSEESLARYMVNGWMNSTGHRENILNDDWSRLGVGVQVRDDGKVFASQAFC